MQGTSMQESNRLQLEMLNMQQVSKDGTNEVSEYVENVKGHFVDQIFSASDIKATMDNCLLEWWAFACSVMFFFFTRAWSEDNREIQSVCLFALLLQMKEFKFFAYIFY